MGGVRLASPIWSYAHPHKPSREPLRLSGRPQTFLQELWGALGEIGGELPKLGEVKGHVPLRKMESPPTGSALLIPVRSPFGKTRASAVGPENWDRDDGREDCGKDGEEQGGGTQLEAPVVSSSRHSRQTDEGAEPGQRAGHG